MTEQKEKYPKVFIVGWIAWMMGLLTAEFVYPSTLMWGACALYFLLLEGVAILREGPHYTYSENVWRFYSGQPARIPLLIGVSGWLCIRIVELGIDVDYTVPGRIIFALGIFFWLVFHFIKRGKWG